MAESSTRVLSAVFWLVDGRKDSKMLLLNFNQKKLFVPWRLKLDAFKAFLFSVCF